MKNCSISVGDLVIWLATGEPKATVTNVAADPEGDLIFTLEFQDNHKPVDAFIDEIKPA